MRFTDNIEYSTGVLQMCSRLKVALSVTDQSRTACINYWQMFCVCKWVLRWMNFGRPCRGVLDRFQKTWNFWGRLIEISFVNIKSGLTSCIPKKDCTTIPKRTLGPIKECKALFAFFHIWRCCVVSYCGERHCQILMEKSFLFGRSKARCSEHAFQ